MKNNPSKPNTECSIQASQQKHIYKPISKNKVLGAFMGGLVFGSLLLCTDIASMMGPGFGAGLCFLILITIYYLIKSAILIITTKTIPLEVFVLAGIISIYTINYTAMYIQGKTHMKEGTTLIKNIEAHIKTTGQCPSKNNQLKTVISDDFRFHCNENSTPQARLQWSSPWQLNSFICTTNDTKCRSSPTLKL